MCFYENNTNLADFIIANPYIVSGKSAKKRSRVVIEQLLPSIYLNTNDLYWKKINATYIVKKLLPNVLGALINEDLPRSEVNLFVKNVMEWLYKIIDKKVE